MPVELPQEISAKETLYTSIASRILGYNKVSNTKANPTRAHYTQIDDEKYSLWSLRYTKHSATKSLDTDNIFNKYSMHSVALSKNVTNRIMYTTENEIHNSALTISHFVELHVFGDVLCELRRVPRLTAHQHGQVAVQPEHLIMI